MSTTSTAVRAGSSRLAWFTRHLSRVWLHRWKDCFFRSDSALGIYSTYRFDNLVVSGGASHLPNRTSSVFTTLASRPGAPCQLQYMFVCAMTCSGGGMP